MRIPDGFYIDNPALPVLRATVSYQNITTIIGNVLGTTLFDAGLATEPSYQGLAVKLLSGDAAGQVRSIATHPAGTGWLTVANAFTDNAGAVVQVVAGTEFVILSIGGGGVSAVAPSVGLWMFGVCDPAMVASTTALLLTNLAGFPDDIFNDEFWVQVIHNDDAPGTAPEREIRRVTDYVGGTGTFTCDAFSVNVEADDLVAVFHESILSTEVLGFGTLDTSSATAPADSARTLAYPWENNDYYKGCMLMPTEGNCRFQPRPIRNYAAATGIFILDEPFTQAPGLVDYVLVGASYPVQRLLDIFNIVNAMLVTTETGGTLTTTGGVDNVYINAAPAGVYEPLAVKIDLTGMGAGHTVEVRTLYQIRPGAAIPILEDLVTFTGVQTLPLKHLALEPNRYGVQVTLERTVGGALDVDWEVIYRV